MIDRWMAAESYYGHGFLIPLVSLYVLWQRRELIRKAKLSGEASGLIIVAVGLFMHILGALLRVYFISGFSFIFAMYGLVLYFFGKEITRYLIFPIFFLCAMIPLPLVLIGNLTVKLKLFVAQTATVILNKIGFPSMRDGSLIIMPNSHIAVEAPCSGLRSLIALVTLGLLFAFAMKVSYVKKATLLLCSIPIAMASNLIRILMLATINDLYGEKIAMGFFHDFSGYLLFAFAFTGLWIVGRILEPKKEEPNE
jgi:exosortase